MQKFRYIKYQNQEEYDSYISLLDQNQGDHILKQNAYLVFLKKQGNQNDQFVGIFNLCPFYSQKIEIRRWILPELRNQGLGTEIAQDISNFAFSLFPESDEMIANVYYENTSSQKSIQKAGYTLDQNEYEKRQELGEGHYFIPYIKKKIIS